MEQDLTFTLPPRLHAGRKRRAAATNAATRSSFFTEDDFNAFSVRGAVHESKLYEELETRRHTIVSVKKARNGDEAQELNDEPKHLMQLMLEAIKNHAIASPEKLVELQNARLRVSTLSITQHERYLALQHKLIQAQKRGLPGILALSASEMEQWKELTTQAREEQLVVCKTLGRVLAPETAAIEARVPTFAEAWYKAMLAQCWNDVYRLYPRYFEPAIVVKIPDSTSRGLAESAVPRIKVTEVAGRGRCCVIDRRHLRNGQPLRVAADEDGGLSLDVASPRHVISADPQAEKLMDQHDCDIAISSSTLVTLFDSDTSARFGDVASRWGIPMKTRSGHGGSKKRIYLDRPLPGGRTSTREKIAEAGRAALLSRFEAESVVEGSTGGRVTYYVWQLENVRVLVRTTTHAYMLSSDKKTPSSETTTDKEGVKLPQPKETPKAVPVSVFVKPDYRLLGVEEQLTTSERCRLWFHSWMRGGSTLLVARFNSATDTVDSWETYSPVSLMYGDGENSPLFECFDPTTKLQWLCNFFNALSDVPVGNNFARSQDDVPKGSYGRRRLGVEILTATAEPAPQSSMGYTPRAGVMDLHQFMPTSSPNDELVSSSSMQSALAVLPAWNLSDRIPYTFRAGSYCPQFFLTGLCPRVVEGTECIHMHLRLIASAAARKNKRWHFQDYTSVLKKAATTQTIVANKLPRVSLSYHFCGESKATPSPLTAASLHARLHCSQPTQQCPLPHLTLHQILHRVADEQQRHIRSKRSSHKSANRQRRQARHQEERALPP